MNKVRYNAYLLIHTPEAPCIEEDGMDDPQTIPPENIQTPSGSIGSVRPSDNNPLNIPATSLPKEVVVDLTTDDSPEPKTVVELIPQTENVATYEVYYKPEGSTEWVPITNDENDEPNVRFLYDAFTEPIFSSR